MDDWGDWEFSAENEILIDRYRLKIKNANAAANSSSWWSLHQYKTTSSEKPSVETMNNDIELNKKELSIINALEEAIETGSSCRETLFAGVPFNSLFKIFHTVGSKLDDFKFSFFCELIASWNSDILIEQSMKAVVSAKLLEKSESSLCTVYAVSQLAKKKSSQLFHYVLSILLSETNSRFSDVELLSKVYESLPVVEKDLVILCFTRKINLNETDWLLLKPLVTCLSPNSVNNLMEVIQKWSNKFTKSQVFGRFLVNFCKNLNFCENKELLLQVVEKHETLFKKQALKILQQS